ncbi:hypothetical protein V5799_013652 [Amblyomma americanum]|uniref:Bicarbonate transporter-like transmembrane domain-containing protein n=1 Tax=Amblyomma americanum TaxID=6943 RepID=A0AAQ4E5B9_AMBAM
MWTIRSVCSYDSGEMEYDQSWLCVMGSMPTLRRKRVAIVRLKHPTNLGQTLADVRFLVLVLTPSKEKGTKNALETGRTFATLFADSGFRRRLWEARTPAEFAEELGEYARSLVGVSRSVQATNGYPLNNPDERKNPNCTIGQGLRDDIRRRLPYYISDYIDVIYDISQDFGFDFTAMYAWVGLWNSFFLFIYVVFDASKIMKWCTRSTEEIFSLFITIAFCLDAGRDVYKDFLRHYLAPECSGPVLEVTGRLQTAANNTTEFSGVAFQLPACQREASMLFLLLTLGTVMLGVSLYTFNKTPYLHPYVRNLLADYALPIAVVVFSFVGSFVFSAIKTEQFEISEGYYLERARIEELPVYGVFGAMGLGFALSLLFFMDQNISAAMVNSPSNKLKKGTAYHLDLLVVAVLNCGLSVFGLPWMHGVLPHSPLHARCLADLEERVDQGHVHEVVVRSRETRLTGIFSHMLIGLSLLMLPYPLSYIPTAVLDGLFLYMAVTSLIGPYWLWDAHPVFNVAVFLE